MFRLVKPKNIFQDDFLLQQVNRKHWLWRSDGSQAAGGGGGGGRENGNPSADMHLSAFKK